MFEAWGRALYTSAPPSSARAAEDAHSGAGHGLPGFFPLGTVATAARDRGAAASPYEE